MYLKKISLVLKIYIWFFFSTIACSIKHRMFFDHQESVCSTGHSQMLLPNPEQDSNYFDEYIQVCDYIQVQELECSQILKCIDDFQNEGLLKNFSSGHLRPFLVKALLKRFIEEKIETMEIKKIEGIANI